MTPTNLVRSGVVVGAVRVVGEQLLPALEGLGRDTGGAVAGAADPVAGWAVAWAVVPLVVAAGMVGLLWVERRRRERLRAWALANGWTYTPSDRTLVNAWRGHPFGEGRRRRATDVLRGTFDGLPALSFTYSWETGDSKSSTRHRAHVMAVALPAYLPTIELAPEGLGTRLARFVGAQDLDFESADFNQTYRVTSSDPQVAYAVVHPRLMERLLRDDARGTPWRIDGTWVRTWAPGASDLGRLAGRLGLLTTVVRSVPRHVWLDHGFDPAARG